VPLFVRPHLACRLSSHCKSLFSAGHELPCKSFSDQRNCQTAGPSLRLPNARLPHCIVILLRHSFWRTSIFIHRTAEPEAGAAASELLCGGDAPCSPTFLGITSGLPTIPSGCKIEC
jgi:hypothetical protein